MLLAGWTQWLIAGWLAAGDLIFDYHVNQLISRFLPTITISVTLYQHHVGVPRLTKCTRMVPPLNPLKR